MVTFTLPWPPTVNTYYTVVRGRKILSTKGRKYKQATVMDLRQQGTGGERDGPISLFIRAYPPDRRKRDLDNILKPILDSMALAGVYGDDSQIVDLRIQKFNPCKPGRVEIVINE